MQLLYLLSSLFHLPLVSPELFPGHFRAKLGFFFPDVVEFHTLSHGFGLDLAGRKQKSGTGRAEFHREPQKWKVEAQNSHKSLKNGRFRPKISSRASQMRGLGPKFHREPPNWGIWAQNSIENVTNGGRFRLKIPSGTSQMGDLCPKFHRESQK